MLTKWSVVTRLSTKWSVVEAGLSRLTPLYTNLTFLGKSVAACFSRMEEHFALKVARKAKSSFNPLTGEAVISRLGGVLVFKNSL